MTFSVRALFFAAYRECVGASEVAVELAEGATVGDLVAQLRASGHPFDALPREPSVAVNRTFGSLSDRLGADDEVAFIPPVAGG
jgi:molybdopterin converting factor subunit 1